MCLEGSRIQFTKVLTASLRRLVFNPDTQASNHTSLSLCAISQKSKIHALLLLLLFLLLRHKRAESTRQPTWPLAHELKLQTISVPT